MNTSAPLRGPALLAGKVCRRGQRIPIVVYALIAFSAACPRSAARADQTAQLVDGRIVAGRITGQSPTSLVFVADTGSERIPLGAIRQINFGSLPRLVSGATPPRRILFRGGESLHAELAAIDATQVTIASFGASSQAVPRSSLHGVFQPAGERSIVYEDFEGRPESFDRARLSAAQHRSGTQSLGLRPSEGANCALLRPLSAGRVELWFYDTGAIRESEAWFVEADFGVPDSTARLSFRPGWNDANIRCTATSIEKFSVERLPRSTGWRRFTLLFDADRIVVAVDEIVLATGAGVGPLSAVRLRAGTAVPADQRSETGNRKPAEPVVEAWVDDFQVFEQVAFRPTPINTQGSDLVRLAEGDELFGAVLSGDPREVVLTGKLGRYRFRWTELRGIEFAAGGGPVGQPVDGLVATVEMAPILGAAVAAGDALVVAVQSASESELVALHPYLGRLRIPIVQVERLIPQFSGSLRLVDAAHHHLGDEIREDFHAKLPEGSRREWSLSLEATPRERVFVSLLAADLEPGAPRALRDGRFRADLAAGHLRTELFVNGRRVDDLNRHVVLPSLAANPQRLRIAVPAGLLKAGANTIRLEQRPARDDPREFDDCEISRLAIEIESMQ